MFTQRNLFIILGVVLLSIAVYPSKVESSFKKGWPRAGEFLIDTNVVYIGVPYNQKCSSIAFDGNNYLVVWQDNRRYSETGHSDFFDIYAARVTPSGEVLDPAGGILVSTGAYSRDNPSVAFNGTDYLVVWGDRRYHWWSCIYGARVDTSGTVLDTAGIYIAGQESGPYCYLWFPSVASDGTNWFAVWLDGRTNKFSIYGARVSPSGTVLDTMGIPISIDATTDEFAPSVAFDGENYLVVWGDENLYGGITWSDLYCARVTPEGEVLDTAGIPIATGPYNQWYPSVAFDGTNYLVVWDDYGPSDYIIYGARVSPAGTVLDPGGFGISHSGAKIYPSVAFDGNNYLVVWQDGRSGITYDIYGVRVSPSGSIQGSEFPVSTGNGHSMGIDPEPAIAFDGTNYMVTWMDIRNVECTGQNIHSARVTPQSTVLDTTGIIVSSTTHSQWEPAVVFDGINYLVAWRDNRHGNSLFVTGQWSIYGARVNSIGTVLDTESIAILSEQVTTYGPSVAFDGTDYLCVWHDLRNWPGNTYDIYGARVAQSGVVLDTTGIPISTAGYYERYPSIAFDGTNYLCVWQTWSSGSYCKIVGGRIDPSGNILDTTSISGLTATNNPYLPPVAFDGINYLVVWEDNRNGNVDIYGARVDTSGTVLDTSGFAISIAIDNQQNPSVAFDGINYLVVWEDFRDGDADIYGARLDTSGTVLDTSGFAISTAIDEQRNLSV
ncbi:hypothetical protein KAX75_13185, partial [candidate division WOR-3 bacterium]|nr:hypothetical protein [candidate division WOR-3 bacterium]